MTKLLILGIDGAPDALTRKLMRMGKLPHLRRLIEEGCYAAATPFWPGETGANWATISTGASPAVHGCAYSVHLPGTPLDQLVSGFPSSMCQAEQIWQTATRYGRRAVIFNYPQSYPVNAPGVIHVGGDGCPDPDHNEIFAQQGYTTGDPPPDKVFGNPVMTRIDVGPADDWANVGCPVARAATLCVRPTWKAAAALLPTEFHLLIEPGQGAAGGRVVLCRDKDLNTALGEARPGEWSEWMVCPVPTDQGAVEVAFRLKVLHMSADGRSLHLYLTQGCRTYGYTTPDELAGELNAHCGHVRRRLVTQQWVLPNACDRRTFLEEAAYQADWYARAAGYIFDHYDWDLFVLKWHGPDILHHHSWHLIDPIHPLYDPDRADEGWELFAALYGIGDRMVGRIVEAAGEDSIVAVVADHGAFASVFANHSALQAALVERGWIVSVEDDGVEDGGAGDGRAGGGVDWSRTRAYATSEGVMLNLKGREPQGCVEPADYEPVRQALIEEMQDMVHPVTGQHLFTLVCRKEEAAFMGFGGPRAGDIFFCNKPLGIDRRYDREYREITSSRHMQGKVTGTHGPYLPSTRFSEGSLEGIFVARGAGLKRGLWRERPTWRRRSVTCGASPLPPMRRAGCSPTCLTDRDPGSRSAHPRGDPPRGFFCSRGAPECIGT
jgi:predicted AlkP superfamily phosphohydrolase/phosphomutase